MNTVTRVYNDGSRVTKDFGNRMEAEHEVEYNRSYRWGCATFLDGECYHRGYLDKDRCDAIAADLKAKET